MRIILIIVCVLPGLIPVRAQDSVITGTHHYFGYNPGYIQLKEMNLIPKVHNGMINAVTYCFERTGRNYQSFHFLFGYSNPKTSIERESPDFQNYRKNQGQVHFRYSYLFGLANLNNIHYYLGPKLSYTYSLSYYYGWDSHAYWGNYISIGPENLILVDFPDRFSWLTSLDLSLLGLYNRPDAIRLYKQEDWSFFHIIGKTNSNYQAGILTNALQVRFRTECRLACSRKYHVAFHYCFYYSRIKSSNSKTLFELIHSIGISIFLCR